ncbi:MAG: hypothetical protein M1833_004074 [Piccolia ochrophora]|nr:MAG: hypothetical protein M1833_004074 [Piccolia ochrophora]
MHFHQLDLTTALRPLLSPEETLLFVQASVGLYEGKYKVPDFQNGQAYLTSHRVCFVDNGEPRHHSVAIQLKDVERADYQAGFLRSSPKITLLPKASKLQLSAHRDTLLRSSTGSPRLGRGSPSRIASASGSASPGHNATWICPICSFSNSVPSSFDPTTVNAHTPLPPCLACGIKPPLAHILKAVVSNASLRHSTPTPSSPVYAAREMENQQNSPGPYRTSFEADISPASEVSLPTISCPRCTFLNHSSLSNCEICGAPLAGGRKPTSTLPGIEDIRTESPGPSLKSLDLNETDPLENIKLSFRGGGDKTFYDRLKDALVQRKWLLQGAPPVPKPNRSPAVGAGLGAEGSQPSMSGIAEEPPARPKTVGIAGLEQRGFQMRKNNEIVIGNAFEDLEALMASAKEIVALAETFSSRLNSASGNASSEASDVLSKSAAALGLVTTKEMLGSSSSSESLYLSELSRNLAEFLTDDATGVLRREGGIMSLVDLWAVFNRARGGVELISPTDFERAANQWETLRLPLRLRRFRSGLLVVQAKEWNDDRTIASILAWLQELHVSPPLGGANWDWRRFGRGVSPQEAAEKFGWSVGVASEELEMAEERGALCRQEGIEGVKFWENWLVDE